MLSFNQEKQEQIQKLMMSNRKMHFVFLKATRS